MFSKILCLLVFHHLVSVQPVPTRLHKRWAVDLDNPAPEPTLAPQTNDYNSLSSVLLGIGVLTWYIFASLLCLCLIKFRVLVWLFITHCCKYTPNRQENNVESADLDEHTDTESILLNRIESLSPEGRNGERPIQVTMDNIYTLVTILLLVTEDINIGVTDSFATWQG